MRIVVFGDSIAGGMRDTEGGGWADRLKLYLLKTCNTREHIFNEVFNLGNPGETSTDLLENYIAPASDEILGTEPRYKEINIIIIATGMNDCILLNNKKYRTSPEQFENNIKNLIEISKRFVNNKIILLGMPPIIESETTPICWNNECYHQNKDIKKYNSILASVCKTTNIYFIDLYKDWIKRDYTSLLSDGLHPNSKGHELIFKTVRDFLIKNKLVKL